MILNLREKPLSSDINRALTQVDYSLRFVCEQLYAQTAGVGLTAANSSTPASGFVGQGMMLVPASPSPNLTVVVKAGLAFLNTPGDVPTTINGVTSLDDSLAYKPVVLTQDTTLGIPTPPSTGLSRIDLVEVRTNRQVTDPQTRLILDPTTGAFNPNTVNKTLENTLDGSTGVVSSPSASTAAIGYKVGGTFSGSFSAVNAPPVTAGYVALGYVYVQSTLTGATASVISDTRSLLFPGGCAWWAGKWGLDWNGGAPTTTLLSLSSPPGVQVGVAPGLVGGSPERGRFNVVVVSGAMKTCPVIAMAGLSSTAPGGTNLSTADSFIVSPTIPSTDNAQVTAGIQSIAAAAVPPVNTGLLTNYSFHQYQTRYQNNGTTSATNSILENLELSIMGVCHW